VVPPPPSVNASGFQQAPFATREQPKPENVGKDIKIKNHLNSTYNGKEATITRINNDKYVVQLASAGISRIIEIYPDQIEGGEPTLSEQSPGILAELGRKFNPVRFVGRAWRSGGPGARGKQMSGTRETEIDDVISSHYPITTNEKNFLGNYKKTDVLQGLPLEIRKLFFQRRLIEGDNRNDLNYLLHLCDLLIPDTKLRSQAKKWLKKNTENTDFSKFEKDYLK
jgi:hypothetical protein